MINELSLVPTDTRFNVRTKLNIVKFRELSFILTDEPTELNL